MAEQADEIVDNILETYGPFAPADFPFQVLGEQPDDEEQIDE